MPGVNGSSPATRRDPRRARLHVDARFAAAVMAASNRFIAEQLGISERTVRRRQWERVDWWAREAPPAPSAIMEAGAWPLGGPLVIVIPDGVGMVRI